MLYYFKRLKVYYWLAAAIGLIVYICLFLNSLFQQQILPFGINHNEPLNTIVVYILLYVWVLFCMLYFRYRARKQWVKMTDILLKDCDPPKFINTAMPLLEKQNPSYNIHNEVCITLSSAYLAAGHYNDMKVLLDSANLVDFQTGQRAQLNKIQYWGNLFSYYLDCKNVVECQSLLEQMSQILPKIKGRNKLLCQRLFSYKQCLYNMELGNTDGAEQLLNEMFTSVQSELERVNVKNTLGGLYLHFGEKQKAREAFEYVAEHGNQLAVAFKAREYLKS